MLGLISVNSSRLRRTCRMRWYAASSAADACRKLSWVSVCVWAGSGMDRGGPELESIVGDGVEEIGGEGYDEFPLMAI